MTATIGLWISLLAVVTVSGYLGQRSPFPGPIALVVVGLALSLVPGWPRVDLNPGLVLDVFLPLLIYTGAVVIPWQAFRHNLRPIGLLSVGLVIVTACGVAALARVLIPGMSWAAAFVLGAVVSPPTTWPSPSSRSNWAYRAGSRWCWRGKDWSTT